MGNNNDNNYEIIVTNDLCRYANKRLSHIEKKCKQKCNIEQKQKLDKIDLICLKYASKNYFPINGNGNKNENKKDKTTIKEKWYSDKKLLKMFFDELQDDLGL